MKRVVSALLLVVFALSVVSGSALAASNEEFFELFPELDGEEVVIHQHLDDEELSIMAVGTYCDCGGYAPLYCRGDYLIYQDNISTCIYTSGCSTIRYMSYAVYICNDCGSRELYTNYEGSLSKHYCDTYHGSSACRFSSIEDNCDLGGYKEVDRKTVQ